MILMIRQQSEVFLSLGANLGDRLVTLRKAVQELNALDKISVVAVSSVYETEPWGLMDQPKFLNIALEIETAFTPLELLHAIKILEQELGRSPGVRWGPRIVDIDIILLGNTVIRTPELTVPHEHFRERHFVLAPLAEIAPDAVDPETGNTIAALRDNLAGEIPAPCADMCYS